MLANQTLDVFGDLSMNKVYESVSEMPGVCGSETSPPGIPEHRSHTTDARRTKHVDPALTQNNEHTLPADTSLSGNVVIDLDSAEVIVTQVYDEISVTNGARPSTPTAGPSTSSVPGPSGVCLDRKRQQWRKGTLI